MNKAFLYEYFTLEPLWLKLIQLLKGEEVQAKEQEKHVQEGSVI